MGLVHFLRALGKCAPASPLVSTKQQATKATRTALDDEQPTMVFVVSIALITYFIGRIDWTKCMKTEDENDQEEE